MEVHQNIEVVMVPFPEQSHLNHLLQLSHIVSSHNIKVHYVASALHVSQVTSRAEGTSSSHLNIEFHAIPTPQFPSPPPSNPDFPSHLIPSFRASAELRHPVGSLLASLSRNSTRRVVVIHDPMMSFVVQDASSLPNVESYAVYCISAISHFVMIRDALGMKIREDVPSPGGGTVDPELQGFVAQQFEFLNKNTKAGILYNTCRVLDGEFLDLILENERKADEGVKLWAFGPLETVTRFKDTPRNARKYNRCLEWLDKQEANSVMYVSFGTTTFIRDDQIRELAIGLEQSEAKFIWVLRDADKADIFDESDVRRPQLPEGYEERVEGMGLGIVVREWAPQMEILGHPSTGGFLTHCGWNSCLESLSLGVPMVTWPMHSDQPINAFLMTQILKAGLAMREWAKKDELVSSLAISEVVKRLMSSEEGVVIRKRAEELGFEVRKSTEKGGVSRSELDSFIAHITRT